MMSAAHLAANSSICGVFIQRSMCLLASKISSTAGLLALVNHGVGSSSSCGAQISPILYSAPEAHMTGQVTVEAVSPACLAKSTTVGT